MISSRTLLFALVGLNLLVFLILAGLLPGAGSDEREPDRLDRQIAPDKLERIRPTLEPSSSLSPGSETNAALASVASTNQGQIGTATSISTTNAAKGVPGLGAAAGQLARGAGVPVTGVNSPTSQTSLQTGPRDTPTLTTAGRINSTQPSVQSSTAPESLAARDNCVLFPETDYLSARRQIEQFAPSLARTSLKRLDAGSYLVFLDPLVSKDAAEQRRDELIASGLSTAQVITSGLLKNGVQLGLVRTAAAAESRRLELLEQGIGEAHIGPLSVTTSRYQAQMWADTALIEQSVRPAARQAGLSLQPCE